MRKEVFETDLPNVRIVCKIGHKGFLGNLWWAYYQKRIQFRLFLFAGPTITIWRTFHRFWTEDEFKTLDELKEYVLNWFNENHKPQKDLYWEVMERNINIK